MIGSTISHYRLVERLGRGAMGLVYKAQDVKLDRPVAVKFISREVADVAEQRTRFIREARTASLLDHPNICTIHDFGETEEGDLFIVMAFCPGENLRVRLEQGPLSLKKAVNIAAQVAQGLAKAHSIGIVHRDIKPANIMLLPDGGVKIVDFGLAKLPHDVGLTNTGGVVGTVPYMSPEQLRGDPLDARTDIWSWGVTFYEMLAGDRPFESKTEATIMRAIMDLQPPSLRARRPDLPPAVDQIISQALRKDREERPASAAELVETLHALTLRTDVAPVVTVAPRPHASVAVLPFRNPSADSENEYFIDGLTEELIHALSRLPGLQVVSRTSAFEFKGKTNVRAIGEQLKVSTVVEGSVRKMGDRIRVFVQLTNVSDGVVLWSERFDCTMTDIFNVQDEMARSIAEMLKVELGSKAGSGGLVKRYTENLQAYDLYLRGRFQWNKRSGEGFQKALEYFQQALELEPNYAPALAGIADYHVSVASWGLEPPTEAWPKAKEAVMKALAADDSLAEAHASMGLIHMWYEWNWKDAEREFLRGIELKPALPVPHIYYNLLLVQTDRSDEAEAQISQALACDPLSVPANVYLAGVYHYRRNYEESLRQARRALDLDANDIEAHVVMALNYEQQHKYKEAIAELEKAHQLSGYNPLLLGPLASCYGGSGDKEKALTLLEELNAAAAQAYVAPISWVMIYLGIGDVEQAFEWLEKAADARDPLLCYLKVGPIYDPLRGDSRYADLLYRIGLSQDDTSELRTVTQHAGAAVSSKGASKQPVG